MELHSFLLVFLFWTLYLTQTSQNNLRLQGSSSKSALTRVTCLTTVLVKSKARYVHVICDSLSAFCPDIVNRISGVTWTLSNRNKTLLKLDRHDYCVIATDSEVSMHLLKMCHRANIILTISDVLIDMKSIFDQALRLGLIDIVIAVADSSHCYVHTYIPFKGGLCYDTSPVILQSWDTDDLNSNVTAGTGTYFPENKIWSLHACTLVVEYHELTGYLVPYWDSLVSFLGVAMNSTVLIRSTSSLVRDLFDSDGSSSLVFLVGSRPDPSLLQYYVIPSDFDIQQVVLVLPEQSISTIQWFRLVNELSLTVWLALLVSFIVSAVTLYICMKKDLGFVVLFSLQPLFGVSWSASLLPWHTRMYFVSWLLFSLVLSSSYLCGLLSNLTVPFREEAIKSIEDFGKSDLHVHYPSYNAYELRNMVEALPRLKPILDKTIFVNESYEEVIDRNRRDIAYVLNKADFEGLFMNTSYRILANEVLDHLPSITVLLSKPSPFERFFAIAYLRAVAAGAVDCVERTVKIKKFICLRRQLWETKGAKAISLLESLTAVFLLWFAGCCLSTFVFCFECFYVRWSP